MISHDLRQRRLAVIREHMDTEVTKEFDATLATFDGHPHYEIMATGQVFDGDDEVMGTTDDADRLPRPAPRRRALPRRRRRRDRRVRPAGTNPGEFYGLPPTGKAFRVPIVAIFFFEATESSTSGSTSSRQPRHPDRPRRIARPGR